MTVADLNNSLDNLAGVQGDPRVSGPSGTFRQVISSSFHVHSATLAELSTNRMQRKSSKGGQGQTSVTPQGQRVYLGPSHHSRQYVREAQLLVSRLLTRAVSRRRTPHSSSEPECAQGFPRGCSGSF